MKLLTKILSIILIIGAIIFIVRYVFNAKTDFEAQIEVLENNNKLLDEKNSILEQDTIKLNISLDSIQELIHEGKIKISEERRKRFRLEAEKNEEIAELQKLDDNDQVEYFIAKTFGNYPVVKSKELYLIDINSITFANNALVNIEYLEEEAESFIDEITELNQQLDHYKGLVGELNAFITTQDDMLDNRNSRIANMNIQIALLDKQNKKLMRNRWIGIGFGILGGSYAALK